VCRVILRYMSVCSSAVVVETVAVDAPLKLAVIGPAPPPNGGMAMQTAQLVDLLREEGCDVRFVAVNPAYWPRWMGRIRGVRAGARLLPYLASLWRELGAVDVVHLMANSGWSWHLFATPAILIARLRGKPVVINYRGGQARVFLRSQARWVMPVMRRAQAMVVPSGFLREVFAEWRLDSRVIPNVVMLERFRFKPEAAIADPRSPVIAVTRNLESIYGVDVALRAFAGLLSEAPGARLLIAGEGPRAEALREQAEELGISAHTEFLGRLDRDAMIALYQRADILLNTSRVDNTPNSLIEAMAVGVAIVSTRAGGIPFLVEDGHNALLCAVDDDACLRQALRRLLHDRELYRHLVENGRESVEAFDWETVRGQWLSLYHELAGRAGL